MDLRIVQAVGITFLFSGIVSAQSKTEITILPSNATVEPGRSVQLSAVDASGEVVNAQWSSEAPNIAIVNNDGVVSGVSAGEAVISAHSGLYWAAVSVIVT